MEEIAVLARRLLDGEPDEERLAQCADEALHQALGYFGLTELPEGLLETVARRAALLYEGGAVASVKRGDFSVSYREDGEDFTRQLTPFRRMVF